MPNDQSAAVRQLHLTIELLKATALDTCRNMSELAPSYQECALGALAAAYLETSRAAGMDDIVAIAKVMRCAQLPPETSRQAALLAEFMRIEAREAAANRDSKPLIN